MDIEFDLDRLTLDTSYPSPTVDAESTVGAKEFQSSFTSQADDFRSYFGAQTYNEKNCKEMCWSWDTGEDFILSSDDNGRSAFSSSSDVISAFSQNEDGDTDLHLGIIQNMTSLILLLISAAPNSEWLNIVNLRRQTPLHLAVITVQKDIVRRLMIAGARVDICDIHGNTPLHIACREGYVDIVQCLLRPVYYEETLVNKYDIPYQRIPQDLTRRNSDGHTCLHLAALSTHLKVLELLVTKGADVNIGDGTSGRTILHYAAETGNRILLHFLMSQRRISISCRTFGGYTPLRVAAGRGYGDVVSTLLDHGADITDIDGSDEDING